MKQSLRLGDHFLCKRLCFTLQIYKQLPSRQTKIGKYGSVTFGLALIRRDDVQHIVSTTDRVQPKKATIAKHCEFCAEE